MVLEGLFDPVEEKHGDFATQLSLARWIHGLLAAAAVLLLVGQWATRGGPSPEARRAGALTHQARHFRSLGYAEVFARVKGETQPSSWTDPSTGKTVVPDLTAIRGDGTLVVVAYLACAAPATSGEAERIEALERLAAERRGKLEVIAEPACGAEPGSEVARRWLGARGLSPPESGPAEHRAPGPRGSLAPAGSPKDRLHCPWRPRTPQAISLEEILGGSISYADPDLRGGRISASSQSSSPLTSRILERRVSLIRNPAFVSRSSRVGRTAGRTP